MEPLTSVVIISILVLLVMVCMALYYLLKCINILTDAVTRMQQNMNVMLVDILAYHSDDPVKTGALLQTSTKLASSNPSIPVPPQPAGAVKKPEPQMIITQSGL